MRPSRNQLLIDALALEVKVRRQALNFTQEDLAGRCEIDRPYISLIEVGKKQPTISVLYRLASALDASFGEFCGSIDARYAKLRRSAAKAKRTTV
jgi:transcriptional regulator with XRE-family HTH domain